FRALGFVAVALFVGGCAARAASGPNARIAVRSEKIAVIVYGQGSVVGPGIDCGPDTKASCQGSWSELPTTTLMASPEAGWHFDHWEWQSDTSVPLTFGDGSDKTTTYRAVFAPNGRVLAKNQGK